MELLQVGQRWLGEIPRLFEEAVEVHRPVFPEKDDAYHRALDSPQELVSHHGEREDVIVVLDQPVEILDQRGEVADEEDEGVPHDLRLLAYTSAS